MNCFNPLAVPLVLLERERERGVGGGGGGEFKKPFMQLSFEDSISCFIIIIVFLERVPCKTCSTVLNKCKYKNIKHMHIRHPKQPMSQRSCSNIQLSNEDRLFFFNLLFSGNNPYSSAVETVGVGGEQCRFFNLARLGADKLRTLYFLFLIFFLIDVSIEIMALWCQLCFVGWPADHQCVRQSYGAEALTDDITTQIFEQNSFVHRHVYKQHGSLPFCSTFSGLDLD